MRRKSKRVTRKPLCLTIKRHDRSSDIKGRKQLATELSSKGKRSILSRADPLTANLNMCTISETMIDHSSADAFTRFNHRNRNVVFDKFTGGAESCKSSTDNRYPELIDTHNNQSND
jgi:hypothetical protein